MTLAAPPAFTSRWGSTRIDFGAGALDRLAAIAAGLRVNRIGMIASPSQMHGGSASAARAALGGSVAATLSEVRPHAPAELCDHAATALQECDAILALGGGSALGLAKASAVRLSVPIVAVPTTYSGSEMTALYGITTAGVKTVRFDSRALPAAVIYDPILTVGLPIREMAASIFNCFAHAVEAAWAPVVPPLAAVAARACAAFVGAGLTAYFAQQGWEAAARLTVAGHLGGVALASGSMGLHHALCHALGGRTGASHGVLNSIVLPAVVEMNEAACPGVLAELVKPLPSEGSSRPSALLRDLRDRFGLPGRLADVGLQREDIPAVAAAAAASAGARANPSPVGPRAVVELLRQIA